MTSLVALTGRIGSGKSSAARAFHDLGVPVLDLDRVGYDLQQRPVVIRQLAAALGEGILDHGHLDRARLRDLCFADRDKLRQLEAVMHPLIWREATAWRDRQRTAYAIIEASSMRRRHPMIDGIITVVTPDGVRHRRILARGRQTEAELARIDRLQQPPAGDFTLENSGDREQLVQQVRSLHDRLLARFEQPCDPRPADDDGCRHAVEQ